MRFHGFVSKSEVVVLVRGRPEGQFRMTKTTTDDFQTKP